MSETTTIANPLGTERIGKLMLRFSIPSIISIVVNSLYNMVDQVFIGWSDAGYLGNAATNVIMPLTFILIALALMLGDGAATFMSLNMGKNRPEVAAQGTGTMVSIMIGVGIFVSIVFEIFLEPLCCLLGATDTVLPYALDYGRIIVIGFPFLAICSAFGGIIRADGRPGVSLIGLLIGCISNIVLDPIFIFVFNLGVKGAAWATIIGQILNAIFFIVCLARCKTIRLKKTDFLPKLPILTRIVSFGASSFIMQIASVLVMAIMNNLLTKYGAASKYGSDIPLAVIGIVMKVNQLVAGVTLGIATGVQPILSYNYGSGQYSRVKKVYKLSLGIGTAIMIAAFCAFQIFPEQIINIFGKGSELYIEFAVRCFRIYLLACFLIPASNVTGIFFQAVGKPLPASIISMSRQIIFMIPAMFGFGALMGLDGILWTGPFADILSCILSLVIVGISWKRIFSEEGKYHE